MHLQFHGAAGEVTGSCHLVEVGGRRVLLDCGLIQGGPRDEARNREPFPFDPASIDALVLSHAHIDHSGRIPQLVQAGFRGPIYTQRACRDLCRVMLRDAAFLQEKDAERDNRK
ncbi:MAG: MBL fold metallo-hydrolase, partial [Candidatus Competibacterales bacterium]|nr:MBL fold metallo-hydrolase [Candidatus Competibacterales bacterium]